MRICTTLNCDKKHYAKGYCKNHYGALLRKGNIRHNCEIKECSHFTYFNNKYCSFHKEKIKRGLPLDLSKKCRIGFMPKGEKHWNWKGGIAEYPNHSFMQRQRLIILLNNPKCEKCGKSAIQIHHKNGNKGDHRLSNLMAVCYKCHPKPKYYKRHKSYVNSKYRKLYGMSLSEISKKVGYSTSYFYKHPIITERLFKEKRILIQNDNFKGSKTDVST